MNQILHLAGIHTRPAWSYDDSAQVMLSLINKKSSLMRMIFYSSIHSKSIGDQQIIHSEFIIGSPLNAKGTINTKDRAWCFKLCEA